MSAIIANLTNKEREELERYVKFFVIKAVQIIVQSRLGVKVFTPCRTHSSKTDWFNLGVQDDQTLLLETKQILSKQCIMTGLDVNIEISLKTSENDTMVLEIWNLSWDSSLRQASKISYTVYNRLGMLLKSLYCSTRASPAYKLSRRQGPDTYIVCYRLYRGMPDDSNLGVKEKRSSIGSVRSPLGSVSIRGTFRTQMLISPTNSYRDLGLDMKENYFNAEEPPVPSSKPCTILGPKQLNEQAEMDTDSSPVVSSLADDMSIGALKATYQRDREKGSRQVHGQRARSHDKARGVAAFAPRPLSQSSLEEDVPFSILLEMSHTGTVEPVYCDEGVYSVRGADAVSKSILDEPDFAEEQRPDEFVIIDVKTPFATPSAETDLGRFYRSCQMKPELFCSGPTFKDTLEQIDIDHYERTLHEFEDFFQQLKVQDFNGSPV